MAEFLVCVAINFLMISGCICPNVTTVERTPAMEELIMDTFYGFYPPDKHIYVRVKHELAIKLPQYNLVSTDNLERHIIDIRRRHWRDWLKHSGPERERMEKTLIGIYRETEGAGRTGHERRMLEELLHHVHPQNYQEYEMYRELVYRWYERNAPLGKVLRPKDIDWTPQRLAYLLLIDEKVRNKGEMIGRGVKKRWEKMYGHLNVNGKTLAEYAKSQREIRKYEPTEREKLLAEQEYLKLFPSGIDSIPDERSHLEGERQRWTAPMNTDLLYIYYRLSKKGINLAAAVKDRWDRMQSNYTHFEGKYLLQRVSYLNDGGYIPTRKDIRDAKKRYEPLTPIPEEILSRRAGRRSRKQLHILEGQLHDLQHENEPASPSIELTPELLAHLREDMAEVNAPNAGHAHHQYQPGHHGSSSHTPIHPDFYGSQTLTPHPEHYFWNASGSEEYTPLYHNQTGPYADTPRPGYHRRLQGGSSGHSSVEQVSSSSIPDTPHPQQYFSHSVGSSSHTSIHEDPLGLISVTLRPQHHQRYPGGSSHTTIDQGRFSSILDTPHPQQHFSHPSGSSSHTSLDGGQFFPLSDTPRPHQYFSHPGGSSSYIHNQPVPSSSLPDIPHQHHQFRNLSGSSDYPSFYHTQTGSYADTPRPPRRQRRQGSSSRLPRRSSQE